MSDMPQYSRFAGSVNRASAWGARTPPRRSTCQRSAGRFPGPHPGNLTRQPHLPEDPDCRRCTEAPCRLVDGRIDAAYGSGAAKFTMPGTLNRINDLHTGRMRSRNAILR